MILPEVVNIEFENSSYKLSSIKVFKANLQRIMNAVDTSANHETIFDSDFIDNHIDAIYDFLKATNQSPVTYTFFRFLKMVNPNNTNIYKIYELKQQQESDKKLNALQKKNDSDEFTYTLDELEEMRQRLGKELEKDSSSLKVNIKYLFLSLIRYLEPQRSEIYWSTKIVNKDEKIGNTLNLTKGILTIRDFKTDTIHEPIIISLPDELMKIVRQVHKNIGNAYLIPRLQNAEQQQTSISLNRFLMDFLGMSTSSLRKLYVTTQNSKKLPIINKHMGHTKQVSDLIYNKNVEPFIYQNGQLYVPAAKNDVIEVGNALYMRKK